MKGLKGPVRRASVNALWCAVAIAMLAAAAASADDRIPRPPGAIDNRGYELVSKDKDRNPVSQGALLSPEGNRVLYRLLGPMPGSPTGSRAILLATRTADGWVSRSALPPRSEMLNEAYLTTLAAADFKSLIASTLSGFGSGSPDMGVVKLDDANHQTVLHEFAIAPPNGSLAGVGSDDLAHVFTSIPDELDASHIPGTRNVYDLGSGTPQLISRMPVTDLAPACGVLPSGGGAPGGFADGLGAESQRWNSTDGRYVFFQSQGDNCGDPLHLYRRDIVAGETIKVSDPIVGADTDNGVDNFLKASRDGSTVIYKTATSLDADDDTDGDANDMDIYRWSASDGNECLSCLIPNANVEGPTYANYNAYVSRDLSRVYFMSQAQFGTAPAPGDTSFPNMYVWHDDAVRFVAPGTGLAFHTSLGTDATPDGHVLVFRSFNPALDAVSGASNGGFAQFYRYDDDSGDVTCISCPPPGQATSNVQEALATGTQQVLPDIHAVSDDGSIVVFLSRDPLVPQDLNQGPDIYEWHNGQVGLITSGREPYPTPGGPSLATISPDGRDILFDDTAILTADVGTDSARKVYDARIDGGFPPPEPPTPPCKGAQCHPLTVPPTLLDPSSLTLTGSGNVRPARPNGFSIGRITASQRLRLAHTGRLTLSVRVRKGGTLSARARTLLGGRLRIVAHDAHKVRSARTVKLHLKLSHAARARLARDGDLFVLIDVRFSGAPSKQLSLSLTTSGR